MLVLFLVVRLSGTFPGDEALLEAMYDAFGTRLDDPMVAVGEATDTVPLVVGSLVVAGVFVAVRHRRAGALFLGFVLTAVVANRVLKVLAHRERPEVRVSPEPVSTFSFPSGHMTSTSAIVVALVMVLPPGPGRRRVALFGGLAVVVVGFSRLAIAVHFLTDIVASVLFVALLGLAFRPVRDRFLDTGPGRSTRDGSGGV